MGAEKTAELDEIMKELDNLEKEISSTNPSKKPDLKVVEDFKIEESEPIETGVEEKSEEITEEKGTDELQEFRGASDEPSMEETLGDLKDEEPSDSSLLNEVSAPTVEKDEIEESVAEIEDIDDIEAEDIEESVETETFDSSEMTGGSAVRESDTKEKGHLSMTMTGDMTLELNYEYDGQTVVVGFSDHYLKVQLADGTEFKIPVSRNKLKAVA